MSTRGPAVQLPTVEAVDSLEPAELADLANGLAERLTRAVARLSAAAGGAPTRGHRRSRPPVLEDCVNVAEAARIAHVSPATVRDWLYKRKLGSVKVSGRVCIRRKDLEALAMVRPPQRWGA